MPLTGALLTPSTLGKDKTVMLQISKPIAVDREKPTVKPPALLLSRTTSNPDQRQTLPRLRPPHRL
jgi:hypothetical protein